MNNQPCKAKINRATQLGKSYRQLIAAGKDRAASRALDNMAALMSGVRAHHVSALRKAFQEGQ